MSVFDKNQVRVLVVDDEEGMRDLLRTELEAKNYEVVTACHGIEALERIRKEPFQLVISDIMMPQMDGMTLLENIKKIDPNLEVILTTAYGNIETAVTAMKMGAYDFILKPFNVEELMVLIEKALEKRGLKTLVALYEASNAIFSTIQLDKLLEMIMDLSQRVLGADEGSIMLLNGEKRLAIAASRGLENEVARGVQLDIGKRIAGLVAKEKKGRLFVNGLEKYPELEGIPSNDRIRSSIVCPLLIQDELLGILNLNRTKAGENFTISDLQSASVFASQAALAIYNAKLYSTLQEAYQRLEKTQGQLLQSEKLASIGRLVAGVAHELNNPLTSVIGFSELALGNRKLAEIRLQLLPIINSEAKRCSKIVKDLLLFARSQKLNYQSLDPCLLLMNILQGISLELGKRKVEIKKDFPDEPILLQADPHLLEQVFSNILINAYQALEEVSGERILQIKVEAAGENLQVTFQDNGPGIPKENIHKIFDPFYTTKEVGKGSGIGLSLVYGIIKEHGGTILAQSEPGEGAVFIVELPLEAQGEIPVTLERRPGESHLHLENGTRILLAEDEGAIRSLIMKIFSEQHYQLDVALDGEEALNKLKKDDYDIVLCDYRMPKLDGIQLYERIKQIKPESASRFLFITGSTEFMRNFDSFFRKNQFSCLLKPFTKCDLISAVNAVMTSGKNGNGRAEHESG